MRQVWRQEKQLEPAVPFGGKALHDRRLVDGGTIDDENGGKFGADQDAIEERDVDVRINRLFMDHEMELPCGLTAEIMLKRSDGPRRSRPWVLAMRATQYFEKF